jgi:hypothetical protein
MDNKGNPASSVFSVLFGGSVYGIIKPGRVETGFVFIKDLSLSIENDLAC